MLHPATASNQLRVRVWYCNCSSGNWQCRPAVLCGGTGQHCPELLLLPATGLLTYKAGTQEGRGVNGGVGLEERDHGRGGSGGAGGGGFTIHTLELKAPITLPAGEKRQVAIMPPPHGAHPQPTLVDARHTICSNRKARAVCKADQPLGNLPQHRDLLDLPTSSGRVCRRSGMPSSSAACTGTGSSWGGSEWVAAHS